MAPPSLEELRAGGKPALARALGLIERHADAPETAALLDEAWNAARAHIVGLTGPPGVGKSSLLDSLIGRWRARGRSVGVIAVDPSSRQSGGALLGDRTRLSTDPEDAGVFVRSMAARERLGGVATLTMPAATLMAALFDIVVVETVGVGQSETEVTTVADTVVFCVQPGSGDSLQFMKAGIVEVPHVAVVTKADIGAAATRARADLVAALGLAATAEDGWAVPVLLVSAQSGAGLDELFAAVEAHRAWLAQAGRWQAARAARSRAWLVEAVRERFGRDGLMRAASSLDATPAAPFGRAAEISAHLARERP